MKSAGLGDRRSHVARAKLGLARRQPYKPDYECGSPNCAGPALWGMAGPARRGLTARMGIAKEPRWDGEPAGLRPARPTRQRCGRFLRCRANLGLGRKGSKPVFFKVWRRRYWITFTHD
jgi:hypothetical protein